MVIFGAVGRAILVTLSTRAGPIVSRGNRWSVSKWDTPSLARIPSRTNTCSNLVCHCKTLQTKHQPNHHAILVAPSELFDLSHGQERLMETRMVATPICAHGVPNLMAQHCARLTTRRISKTTVSDSSGSSSYLAMVSSRTKPKEIHGIRVSPSVANGPTNLLV